MSSTFQNLGGIRRGMVRPQQVAPGGLGNPAQGQPDDAAPPQGGSSFLPQTSGGGSVGGQQPGPPQAQLGAFMDKLAQARPNNGQAGGGLPPNYGGGGGRGYAGGTPRPDFNRRPPNPQQGGNLGGAPGPQMGKPNPEAAKNAAAGQMNQIKGGPPATGGSSKAQGLGQPSYSNPATPGYGPPQQPGGYNWMSQGGPAQPAPGGGAQPAGGAAGIYNPQSQLGQAAQGQSATLPMGNAPVSMAQRPPAASNGGQMPGPPPPQTDTMAPTSRDEMANARGAQSPDALQAQRRRGAPMAPAPPQMAGGSNLGGQTREDYNVAGDASGGL